MCAAEAAYKSFYKRFGFWCNKRSMPQSGIGPPKAAEMKTAELFSLRL